MAPQRQETNKQMTPLGCAAHGKHNETQQPQSKHKSGGEIMSLMWCSSLCEQVTSLSFGSTSDCDVCAQPVSENRCLAVPVAQPRGAERVPIISKSPLLFLAPTVRSIAARQQQQQSRERQQCQQRQQPNKPSGAAPPTPRVGAVASVGSSRT